MTFATDELHSDLENMDLARNVSIHAGEGYFWHTTVGELLSWLNAYRDVQAPPEATPVPVTANTGPID